MVVDFVIWLVITLAVWVCTATHDLLLKLLEALKYKLFRLVVDYVRWTWDGLSSVWTMYRQIGCPNEPIPNSLIILVIYNQL